MTATKQKSKYCNAQSMANMRKCNEAHALKAEITQAKILRELIKGNGRASAIAAIIGVHQVTITGHMVRMSERGDITRDFRYDGARYLHATFVRDSMDLMEKHRDCDKPKDVSLGNQFLDRLFGMRVSTYDRTA